MARVWYLTGWALGLWLFASSPVAQKTEHVLFIGNSLTFVNDVPGMVEALSASRGPRWSCEAVAVPDFSLEDHWNRGDAVKAIARGGWTTVVLQQGPSALPESRASLVEYTKKFDAEVRHAGARTALYMVWPSVSRGSDFDGVAASYAAAAQGVRGLLLPVGEAWRAAWKRDSKIALYGPDGFHPTVGGSYLAALVIYAGVSGRSPIGLPNMLALRAGDVTVPSEIAAVLQQAAAAR